jgi:hypothetical protein
VRGVFLIVLRPSADDETGECVTRGGGSRALFPVPCSLGQCRPRGELFRALAPRKPAVLAVDGAAPHSPAGRGVFLTLLDHSADNDMGECVTRGGGVVLCPLSPVPCSPLPITCFLRERRPRGKSFRALAPRKQAVLAVGRAAPHNPAWRLGGEFFSPSSAYLPITMWGSVSREERVRGPCLRRQATSGAEGPGDREIRSSGH